ncbi:signal peptidase [Alkalibacillus filiformis]|uniref:Signal peptidase I n=1 Tax=Alkalibacillus filiformis TaxID=200990 RepID=A0ABU0DW89_9BACI|nr:signal peptidase I [Alkalibacillus filiformis]MDQ0352573.1 signal peptidase [Alkalibacillus filiformis]
MAKKVWKWSLNIVLSLLAVLLLLTVYTSFQANNNPGNVPTFFGITPLTILSDSMDPEFISGDLVFIKNTEATKISSGDIITYQLGDMLVTHRVIDRVEQDGVIEYETKGDNVELPDQSLVSEQNLVGEYVFKIPKAGHLMQFASTPMGTLVLFGIPFVLYVAVEIYDRVKRRNDREQEAA